MTEPRPGWSERQYRKAMEEIEKWPEWMRPNLYVRSEVMKEREAMQNAARKDGRMTEREENNRILAEWVGGFGDKPCPDGGCESYLCRNGKHPGKPVPNFYTDETANAAILDKLLSVNCSVHLIPFCGEVMADMFRHFPTHRTLIWSSNKTDRKAAICAAALLIARPA